jgi:hypothetical protein
MYRNHHHNHIQYVVIATPRSNRLLARKSSMTRAVLMNQRCRTWITRKQYQRKIILFRVRQNRSEVLFHSMFVEKNTYPPMCCLILANQLSQYRPNSLLTNPRALYRLRRNRRVRMRSITYI